jgi:hypothetical protein
LTTVRARLPTLPAALAMLATLALAWLSWRQATVASFGFGLFADRDLIRGLRFFQELPTSGAELSAGVGARVPGAWLGVLFGLPQWLGGDARAVFLFQVALECAAVVWLHAIVARRQGPLMGLVAAAALLGSTSEIANVAALWNPGFLPLFVVGAYAGFDRAVLDRRASGVWTFALFTALGAQLHLSMMLVAAPLALVLLWRGVTQPGRAALGALVAALIAYAPYWIGEALTGFSNGRDLGRQDVVQRGLSSFVATPQRWWFFLKELVGTPWQESDGAWLPQSGDAVHAAVTALAALAALTTLWSAGRVLRAGRQAASAEDLLKAADALPLLLGIGYLATDATLGPNPRYVVAFAPVWARLIASAAHTLTQGARRPAPRAVVTAALVLVVVAATTPGRTRFFVGGPRDMNTLTGLSAWVDGLRERTGWTLADAIGRTAWLKVEGGVLRTNYGPSLQHLLVREGQAFPGSLPPPCAVVLDASAPGEEGAWTPDKALAALVGPDGVATSEVVETAHAQWSVLYTPRHGRCPTTMTQRYIPTPTEARLRQAAPGLGCGQAALLPAVTPGATLWGVRYDVDPRSCDAFYMVGVELARTREGVAVTLHGNQLRGDVPNVGVFNAVLAWRPTVSFVPVAGGEPVSVPLAEGTVGGTADMTPLQVVVPLPEGTWAVRLHLDVLTDITVFPVPADLPVRNALDVLLSPAWSTAPGPG